MTTTLTFDEALTVLYQHADDILDALRDLDTTEQTAERELLKRLKQLASDMRAAIDEYDESGAVDHD